MEGLLFGVIDNAVLIAGAVFGLEIERVIPGKIRAGSGGVMGAALGNAVSDYFAGLGEFGPALAMGVFLGCLIPCICLPWIAKVKTKVS